MELSMRHKALAKRRAAVLVQRLWRGKCVREAACARLDCAGAPPVISGVLKMQALLRGDFGGGNADGLKTWGREMAKVPRVWRMAPRYWALVDFVNFRCVALRLRRYATLV